MFHRVLLIKLFVNNLTNKERIIEFKKSTFLLLKLFIQNSHAYTEYCLRRE